MSRPNRLSILRSRQASLAEARVRLEAAEPTLPVTAAKPMSFREYVDKVKPNYQWYPHCVTLAAVLQRVADGELSRVMVFEPPRHGKSELVSRLFPGYYLYRYPERWVGLNSYGQKLANTLSRAAKQNFERIGGEIERSASAVMLWQTTKGGGLWAAGVGGPITGMGFHLGIIDDPLKNAEAAESEVIREGQKDWYNSTFYSRGEPGEAIVVVQTRWHEDDLSGYILGMEEDEDETPERWHIVNLPAIKEAETIPFPPTCTIEPDPRAIGEALCTPRYPLGRLAKIMRVAGSYVWNALFQQRPSPPGGGMFTTFPIVDAIPAKAKRVRYWDKAGTDGGGDFSAGVKLAWADGVFYIEDVVEGQWSAGKREAVILDTAELDGKEVHIWLEQEPGSGGKESAENSVKMLAGWNVYKEPVTGAKESRARPVAAQAEIGNVKMLRAPWNKRLVAQAQAFPNGKHDDIIDGLSGAFNKLVLAVRPTKTVASRSQPIPPVPQAGHLGTGIPNALGTRR